MASQTLYLPSYHVHRRSSPVRCSRPSPARAQNISRMPNEYGIFSLFSILSLMPPFFLSVLQGIDQDLKRACEAVISMASESLCAPLRAFTGRPASAAEAAVLDETFRTACASDLRSSLARLRLYVSEVRTAAVLVQHAVDRVEDAYGAFRLAARQVGARVVGENGLMDDDMLKRLLKDVCGDDVDGAKSQPSQV